MKKLMALSVMTSALMAPVLANAAATADIKLIGTITPAACVPNFTGGSTIDYGNIAANTLSTTTQTNLPAKSTKLSVVCDAPVKFAFGVTDERAATLVSATGMFGLGAAENGAGIGGYSLTISNETADTGVTRQLYSSDAGVTWAPFGGALDSSRTIGFGNSATATVPSAHKSISVDIAVTAAIDKSSNLPIANEIKIDGLNTRS